MRQQPLTLFYILMFIAMIGWGASWVHAKYLSEHLTIHEIIFYRYFFTAISMLPLLWFLKLSVKIDRASLLNAFVNSVIMIIYTWLFIEGTHLGTASLGGAFVTTLIPIVTFTLTAIISKKMLKKEQIFALVLGAIGVMTILNVFSFSAEQILKIQNLYFVIAAFTWAVLTILSAKASKVNPLVYSFWLYFFVSILELLFIVDFKTDMMTQSAIVWANILSIALFSTTFATSIYFVGGQKIGADKISSFTFLVPFSAIGLSAIFLNEKISWNMIVGTVMAVVAIYILNRSKKRS